ncbi:MAG: hypothetical protein NC905_01135 [Candidatus Omnitrophica bacterium]|nr:hypothetical protein [Candidatus Omnitrophota bacterium]
MKKKMRGWGICILLISQFSACSEINLEKGKDKEIVKIKKEAVEIVLNTNPAYGTLSINTSGERMLDITPGFVKLYPTEEKGKYRTVNYWIPAGKQKLKYFINQKEDKTTIIITRDFDGDFYIKDYVIVEENSPYITYITESQKNRDNFGFEYINNFRFANAEEIIWQDNRTIPENLGDYWQKYIEVKNSRWVCGYNKSKNSGVLIIRDFGFAPDSAWHHFRIYGGPTLASKITQRDYITRREFKLMVFENKNPEEVIKNIRFRDVLPSHYTIAFEKRIYPLFFKEKLIELDGEIKEDAWSNIQKERDFYRFDWGKTCNYYQPDKQTEFQGFYDKQNLYLAIKCYEDNIKNLRVEQKTGSKQVWTDDCVEIFIQPSGMEYFQFIINPLGEKQDNKGLVDSWEAKGKIFDDYWSVEVKIPLSLFDRYPKDGEIWGFNICRERRPTPELSSWNATSGSKGFHQPEKFGQLVFSPQLSPKKLTILEGKDTIGVLGEIINWSKETIKEPARILISVPEEKALENISLIELAKGEKHFISYIEKTNIQKGYNISFDITSKTGIAYYSQTFQKTGYSGLVSRLWPLSYGNIMYIMEDRAQIIPFLFANYTEQLQTFSLIIECPEEMELLFLNRKYNFSYGQFFPLSDVKEEKKFRDNLPYKKYTLNFLKQIGKRALPVDDEERNYERVILPFYLGKTDLKNFKIYFHLESEAIKEKDNLINVKVVPSFKAKSPRNIESGVFDWYFGAIQNSLNNDEEIKGAASKTASTITESGMNTIVYSVYNKEIRDALNRQGVRIRPSFWWFWWDKEYLEKHPEAYAIDFDGKKAKYFGIETVCPTVLIKDEKAFENTKKLVQELVTVKGNDIWHDTEGPSAWSICFCDRCINEFKKFAKIPEQEQLDPKQIKLKYKNEWLNFADWQQAVIFAKVNKAIKEANPDAKFTNYGGLVEPEHRCNWKLLTENNSIDIAGPSMYELSSGTLKYWETEMREFKKKVKNLKVTPWLNNEARQRNYKLLRTQALKSITIGTDGYHIYYGQILFRDGRRLYDLGVVNTIISDFEDFFVAGEPLKGDIFDDINQDNFSIDGWKLNNEKVIFIFNHDDKNEKAIRFPIPFEIGKEEIVFDYMKKKKIQGNKEISMVLEDLGIGVVYIGDEKKLLERIKVWGDSPISFYIN